MSKGKRKREEEQEEGRGDKREKGEKTEEGSGKPKKEVEGTKWSPTQCTSMPKTNSQQWKWTGPPRGVPFGAVAHPNRPLYNSFPFCTELCDGWFSFSSVAV